MRFYERAEVDDNFERPSFCDINRSLLDVSHDHTRVLRKWCRLGVFLLFWYCQRKEQVSCISVKQGTFSSAFGEFLGKKNRGQVDCCIYFVLCEEGFEKLIHVGKKCIPSTGLLRNSAYNVPWDLCCLSSCHIIFFRSVAS